jgi:hypothetical protein
VRLINTTGLPASGHTLDPISSLPITQCTGTATLEGCLDANPSRGTEKTITGQVIGSGLYKAGDIWSFSATLNTSSNVSGNSFFVYNHMDLNGGWTLDSSLQLYKQTDQFNAVTTRFSPMVRGAYRLRDQLTFDVDGGFENTKYEGAQATTKTVRFFASAGVRWDF